jgi:hypothetical protein
VTKVVLIGMLAVMVTAGCGASRNSAGSATAAPAGGLAPAQQLTHVSTAGLFVYDTASEVNVVVTRADVIRSSVRAVHAGYGWSLVGDFTGRGAAKFCDLTRALAHRGARLHHHQRFAFQVAGRIYARLFVDYRATPNGLCGSPGFEVTALTHGVARKIAVEIRTG